VKLRSSGDNGRKKKRKSTREEGGVGKKGKKNIPCEKSEKKTSTKRTNLKNFFSPRRKSSTDTLKGQGWSPADKFHAKRKRNPRSLKK